MKRFGLVFRARDKLFNNEERKKVKYFTCIGLGDSVPEDSDSIDVFQSISSIQESPRKNIIHIIDEDCEKGHWQVGRKKNASCPTSYLNIFRQPCETVTTS